MGVGIELGLWEKDAWVHIIIGLAFERLVSGHDVVEYYAEGPAIDLLVVESVSADLLGGHVADGAALTLKPLSHFERRSFPEIR